MPQAAQAPSAPARVLSAPEELLGRAHWFGEVVRALVDGAEPAIHAEARSAPRAGAGSVLVELRLQSRLLAAIQELPEPARGALVAHYFRGPKRSGGFGRRRERRTRAVEAALVELRSMLDRDAGGRARWITELPAWALLDPASDELATPLLPDRASRVLVVLVMIVIAGFLVWISRPTWATTAGEAKRSAPMLTMFPPDAPACIVEGRLSLEGCSFAGWTLLIAPRGHEDVVVASGEVAEDGSFRIESHAQGAFTLVARDLPGELASRRLELPVMLGPGRLRVDCALPAARLSGASRLPGDEDLLHVWTGPAGRAFTTRIHAEKLARLGELVFPAGHAGWRRLPAAAPWPETAEECLELPAAEVAVEERG
ncbi:MAG: hypothetical protein HZA53_06515 [Planctomycetes bacterium]|nr:hypothetical protein [Planctomycetota bacterium]